MLIKRLMEGLSTHITHIINYNKTNKVIVKVVTKEL